MSNILVSSDDIRAAMKSHVVNPVSSPQPRKRKGSAIRKSQEVRKNAKIYGRHIKGFKNQVCPFCKETFEKAGLHSPYCLENPNRIPGNRAKTLAQDVYVDFPSAVQNDEVFTDIVRLMVSACNPNVFIHHPHLFSEWNDLTKKILAVK